MLEDLIRDLAEAIRMFYAWQHGSGCMKKLPKDQELLQMPGRGDLDFVPLISDVHDINYQGWISIFMHPVTRGIPILATTTEVRDEINRARNYFVDCLCRG